jgi:hypothetical protein
VPVLVPPLDCDELDPAPNRSGTWFRRVVTAAPACVPAAVPAVPAARIFAASIVALDDFLEGIVAATADVGRLLRRQVHL